MGHSFWFDPTVKQSQVDSTVYGNKFLDKYWQMGSSSSEPMGTSVDPSKVFSSNPYDSLLKSSSSSNPQAGSTTKYSVFDSYWSKDFSDVGTGSINPPIKDSNGSYSNYQDLVNGLNDYKKNAPNANAPAGIYGIFENYHDGSKYEVSSKPLSKPLYIGNGTSVSSYDELINGFNAYMEDYKKNNP